MLQRVIDLDGRFRVGGEALVEEVLPLRLLQLAATLFVLVLLEGGLQVPQVVLELVDAHFGVLPLRRRNLVQQNVQPVAVAGMEWLVNLVSHDLIPN